MILQDLLFQEVDMNPGAYARALLTIDFRDYNQDSFVADDLVRIPLNNAKARDIVLDIQNTMARLRGSAPGQWEI